MNQAIDPFVLARQSLAPDREFAMQFTSTPRGAHLARRLVSHRLDEWGYPYDSAPNETLTLIAAELSANAVRHGHVPGRDFRLRLTSALAGATEAAITTTLRVEVTDTRTERCPSTETRDVPSPPDAESGRGLYLVSQLADQWCMAPRSDGPGKCVWAQLHVDAPAARFSDVAGARAVLEEPARFVVDPAGS
ncbi:MAG: ATP-binding protein [Streptomyces sp.]|uniref:ATP-binding protein n=1 Tax=Streptomyces sp. TaxID=1931 RepID=UPI003D6BFC56